MSGEGHVDEEQSIIDSIMESVNLTMEGFGRLSLIDPVPKSDEHVSDKNYQFRTRHIDMADKIEESSPDSPDFPDSGSDGGPLLNLSNTELVADLEGFGRLNIIDPADNKYQFRTRRTNMADNIQESSPEDLFEESESDFKMPSHSGPIVWKGDPDLPGVRIRELSVNIRKCTTVSGEGHVEEEQSIIDSIMESVNLTVPLRVAKDIPVLNSLLSPILASNCPLPPVAGGSVPDSGSDGGPLLNLSDTELVADLEGFGRLNLIDPVPQSDEHVSDNNYQFRTRRRKEQTERILSRKMSRQ